MGSERPTFARWFYCSEDHSLALNRDGAHDCVGGFIYIALVKVTPQLLENCDPVQTLKEVGAM